MAWLKCNPFPVRAHFDFSITLTFAVPLAELQERLPWPLVADSFEDRFGFLAVAFVKTRNLRPAPFPQWLGRDFLLIGYRHFVRYRTSEGRNLRGLHIIRSETEKRAMKRLGSLFTPYQYTHHPLRATDSDDSYRASCESPPMHIDALKPGATAADLPEGSVFPDWRAARRFCGPMPYTFSAKPEQNSMLLIEGARTQWKPEPIQVSSFELPYLTQLGFSEARLSAAFMVKDVDYEWRKGKLDPLTPPAK